MNLYINSTFFESWIPSVIHFYFYFCRKLRFF